MFFVKFLIHLSLILSALFLILIVMLQRGKGGGLAGALGGMGGQSAFGAKAGDLFTRITIGVAAFWIILSTVAVRVYAIREEGPLSGDRPRAESGLTPADRPDSGAGEKSAPAESSSAPAEKPAGN